jgi:hypothetical protein
MPECLRYRPLERWLLQSFPVTRIRRRRARVAQKHADSVLRRYPRRCPPRLRPGRMHRRRSIRRSKRAASQRAATPRPPAHSRHPAPCSKTGRRHAHRSLSSVPLTLPHWACPIGLCRSVLTSGVTSITPFTAYLGLPNGPEINESASAAEQSPRWQSPSPASKI